ncbi:hypothetical protein MD484_g6458, partial [Candolleomyces efflorescens]
MTEGFRLKFNNASQRIFGGTVRPTVLAWETNDAENSWSAEARLIDINGDKLLASVGQATASRKQEAKELAAKSGFERLREMYPSIDLSDI